MVSWKVFHPDYPNSVIAKGICMMLDGMISLAKSEIDAICKEHFRLCHGCDKLVVKFTVSHANGGYAEWSYVQQRNVRAA